MQQIVEKEINPISNLIIFGGYCFGGVTMLSYFSFRAFRNIEYTIKIDRPSGERLTLSKMRSIPGLSKAVSLYLGRSQQPGHISSDGSI